jgi:hypothetical protein
MRFQPPVKKFKFLNLRLGSTDKLSEVSIAGLHSNVANNAVAVINLADPTNVNFYIDITVRCFSSTAAAISNFSVLKPTSSSTWPVFYGLTGTSDSAKLLAPTISVDSGTYKITIQQSAASTDDGTVNYMIKFASASGNSSSYALPIFKTS